MSTFNVSTATFQQLKTQRLKIQTEREIILNEMMKGTVVRWEDIMTVIGGDIIDCRNAILAYPSKFADKLSREEVETMRQGLRDLLRLIAKRQVNDVQRKNKYVTKYTKASKTVADEENYGRVKGMREQNKRPSRI